MVKVNPSFKKTFQLLKKQDKAFVPVASALITIGLALLIHFFYQALSQGYSTQLGSSLLQPALGLLLILAYPLGMLCDKKWNTEKEITTDEYNRRKANGTLDDIFTYVI
jgi:hypothetical protein